VLGGHRWKSVREADERFGSPRGSRPNKKRLYVRGATARVVAVLVLAQPWVVPSRGQEPARKIAVPAFRSVRLARMPIRNGPAWDQRLEFRSDAREDSRPGSDRFVERTRPPRNHVGLAPFVLLSAGVYGLASLDMHETVATCACHEHDPLAQPLTRLPTPAYYASGIGLATGLNWLAWKMEHSRRWHRVWWLPQVGAMAGNLWGYASTKTRE
jgi:hypothetical protein